MNNTDSNRPYLGSVVIELQKLDSIIDTQSTNLTSAEECTKLFSTLMQSLHPEKNEHVDSLIKQYTQTMSSSSTCSLRTNISITRARMNCSLCMEQNTNCIIAATHNFKAAILEIMRTTTLRQDSFKVYLDAVRILDKITGLFYGVRV